MRRRDFVELGGGLAMRLIIVSNRVAIPDARRHFAGGLTSR